MTWLEALWMSALALAFVKWHWHAHIVELDRRVKEFAVRLVELKTRDLNELNEKQTAALKSAEELLETALTLQQRVEVGDSDEAVREGHRYADCVEDPSCCALLPGYKRPTMILMA